MIVALRRTAQGAPARRVGGLVEVAAGVMQTVCDPRGSRARVTIAVRSGQWRGRGASGFLPWRTWSRRRIGRSHPPPARRCWARRTLVTSPNSWRLAREAVGRGRPRVGRSPPDALVIRSAVAETVMPVFVRQREAPADNGRARVDQDELRVALPRRRTGRTALRQACEHDVTRCRGATAGPMPMPRGKPERVGSRHHSPPHGRTS